MPAAWCCTHRKAEAAEIQAGSAKASSEPSHLSAQQFRLTVLTCKSSALGSAPVRFALKNFVPRAELLSRPRRCYGGSSDALQGRVSEALLVWGRCRRGRRSRGRSQAAQKTAEAGRRRRQGVSGPAGVALSGCSLGRKSSPPLPARLCERCRPRPAAPLPRRLRLHPLSSVFHVLRPAGT